MLFEIPELIVEILQFGCNDPKLLLFSLPLVNKTCYDCIYASSESKQVDPRINFVWEHCFQSYFKNLYNFHDILLSKDAEYFNLNWKSKFFLYFDYQNFVKPFAIVFHQYSKTKSDHMFSLRFSKFFNYLNSSHPQKCKTSLFSIKLMLDSLILHDQTSSSHHHSPSIYSWYNNFMEWDFLDKWKKTLKPVDVDEIVFPLVKLVMSGRNKQLKADSVLTMARLLLKNISTRYKSLYKSATTVAPNSLTCTINNAISTTNTCCASSMDAMQSNNQNLIHQDGKKIVHEFLTHIEDHGEIKYQFNLHQRFYEESKKKLFYTPFTLVQLANYATLFLILFCCSLFCTGKHIFISFEQQTSNWIHYFTAITSVAMLLMFFYESIKYYYFVQEWKKNSFQKLYWNYFFVKKCLSGMVLTILLLVMTSHEYLFHRFFTTESADSMLFKQNNWFTSLCANFFVSFLCHLYSRKCALLMIIPLLLDQMKLHLLSVVQFDTEMRQEANQYIIKLLGYIQFYILIIPFYQVAKYLVNNICSTVSRCIIIPWLSSYLLSFVQKNELNDYQLDDEQFLYVKLIKSCKFRFVWNTFGTFYRCNQNFPSQESLLSNSSDLFQLNKSEIVLLFSSSIFFHLFINLVTYHLNR